jgi:hypothetical protein
MTGMENIMTEKVTRLENRDGFWHLVTYAVAIRDAPTSTLQTAPLR